MKKGQIHLWLVFSAIIILLLGLSIYIAYYFRSPALSPESFSGCIKLCESQTDDANDLEFLRCVPQNGGEKMCGSSCQGVFNDQSGNDRQLANPGASCELVDCECN